MRLKPITAKTFIARSAVALAALLFSRGAWALDYDSLARQVDTASIQASIETLAGYGSRVPGYPGDRKAAVYVEEKLRALGLEVRVEEFSVTVPVDKGGTLNAGGSTYPVHSLWPNNARTSTLPVDGLEGHLIYGGKGEFREFNGKDLEGAIVLMDFNSQDNWLNAAMLGAKAVVFIEPERTIRMEAERKFLATPLNMPRFYLERAGALALLPAVKRAGVSGLPATMKARMDWEKVQARNILAFLPGKDPELKKETIVIQAYYDSMSVVPALAPGAENAIGIATMLEIAKVLKDNPPGRTVLFLANSAHFTSRKGIRSFVQKHARTQDFYKGKLEDPIKIDLFIGLELSSHSDELAVWHNTDENHGREFYRRRFCAPFARKFIEEYSAEICSRLGYVPEDILSNGVTPVKGIGWKSMMPGPMKPDATVLMDTGNPAVSFVTVRDTRNLVDTPLDRPGPAYIDYKNIFKQARFLACILKAVTDDPSLWPRHDMKLEDQMHSVTGTLVRFDPKKSFVPDTPLPGALAEFRMHPEKTCKGVRMTYFNLVDEEGKFTDDIENTRLELELHGYVFDESGDIVYAADRGPRGDQNYPMLLDILWWTNEHMIVLFRCVATNIFELVDPRYLTHMTRMDIFDANNSTPRAYGFAFTDEATEVRIGTEGNSLVESTAVAFSVPGSRLKLAFGTGALGMRELLINSPSAKTKQDSEGIGFPASSTPAIIYTPFQAASDMYLLDDYRISELRSYGISNTRLDQLHEQGQKFLESAREAKEEKRWDDFIKYARRSAGIESRAYPDVKGTTTDVVKAIIFYLFLLLPFSYLLERLITGFTDIRKQIAGIFVIFLGIYSVMRFVHPAFRLTFAPEIILLAFILLALSIMVIILVAGKFEELMKKQKTEAMKVHDTQVSRTSVLFCAFSLGVSNMRRRKTRTALTSVTLILLTFTVLSFTSVKSYMRFHQTPRDNKPLYQGMLVRDRMWFPMEEKALEYLQDDFAGEATVAPRSWYVIRGESGQKTYIKIRHGKNTVNASSMLGLVPEEKTITGIDSALTAGRWFEKQDEYAAIVPDLLADLLSISTADVGSAKIEVFGNSFTVIGIADSEKLNALKDLDDELLTPVDFMGSGLGAMQVEMATKRRAAGIAAEGKGQVKSFLHIEPDRTLIVPYQTVMNAGGTIQSAAISFDGEVDLKTKVEELIARLALTLFAGIGDRVSIYSSLGLTSFSGMGNLFVPILIAALIVLNTMMGSVYERFKEIGTYSSVGLAPMHISMLFIAEACVYAIIGGIAGYLVGQVATKLLTVTGALQGLTLNYSSLAAVSSTMLVMAVVLLSTLYPARQAARMAVPDVTRKWVIPEPTGDRWKFDFPFTVSEVEVLGLFVFLRNYFASYTEESVGTFYTEGTEFDSFALEGREEKGFLVRMTIWLAPFDLGVSQKVELMATPTDDKGIYLVVVNIDRVSGEAGDWIRLNRNFLDSLRKQFLIWRTVPEGTKSEYRSEGETLIA